MAQSMMRNFYMCNKTTQSFRFSEDKIIKFSEGRDVKFKYDYPPAFLFVLSACGKSKLWSMK